MSSSPRFIVDAMLGSLARKLRIFGFDTLYFKEGSDLELELIARAEGRAIITADRALTLHSNRHGLLAFSVEGRSDQARLRSLLTQARSASLSLSPGEPRCALCNSGLTRVGKDVAALALPESVTSRHRVFYRCRECCKLYWRGGHWSRLGRLSTLVSHR